MFGGIVASTKVSGRAIKCTEEECIIGKMAELMPVCMSKMSSTVMVNIPGLMEGCLKASGSREKGKAKAVYAIRTEK